ncbi:MULTISPECIES: hypothetical protein [Streptomyces]|uniref:Uncharacterized protein n=2 Tax=Streptomyces TaxID=1883 RepID=A0A100Y6N4_9ACTN|nr:MULTISPECIES: hypothetical protein [Streptomyces]KUH38682.1 hypothetical protein ATE80_11120 [Streptomyces kanasensis]UUS32056.1 hypothetical protein NRO40_15335 [Streptomyces changanensis]
MKPVPQISARGKALPVLTVASATRRGTDESSVIRAKETETKSAAGTSQCRWWASVYVIAPAWTSADKAAQPPAARNDTTSSPAAPSGRR